MFRIVAAALAAVPLLAAAQDATRAPAAAPDAPPAPAAAAADAAPLREGVYLGVGLGVATVFSSDQDVGLGAYRIRLGMTRSPRLQLGLEIQHAEDTGVQFDFIDVAATFYPWRRIFFVRGGFGFSSIVQTDQVPFSPGFAVPSTSGGSGINLLAGLGAQLGRSNGVNFTINLEGQAHRLRGVLSSDHGSEATLSAWLGLEWH
jgi:hypothetical protein